MKSYYNFNSNFEIIKNFSFDQDQLFIKKDQTIGKNAIFNKVSVKYHCVLELNSKVDEKKPGIILCIKDNLKLLEFTYKKMVFSKIFEYCNLLVLDDRSEKKEIKDFCFNNKINYIRVENEYGFNFSMLNNIGAKFFKDNNCKEIIFWNSDVWPENEEVLPNILKLHNFNNSDITGTRLIYPEVSWDGNSEVPENISLFFKNLKTYRGTCQFGGSSFLFNGENYHSNHYGRFKNSIYTKLNQPTNFITGAFMIVNVKKFFEVGCFNPSLSLQCQDLDLCLKIREKDGIIYYIGQESLYHDESVSLKDKMQSLNYVGDNFLFNKIWNLEKMVKILTGDL